MVAMYKNVPAEIEVKMPQVRLPESLKAHPIAIPNGFITAWMAIMMVLILTGMLASEKARPSVSPSAHL